MALYSYQGMKYTGEKQRGSLRANSVNEAKMLLKAKHIKPVTLVEQGETLANKEIQLFNKVSLKILKDYLQQLSTLISSGITVLDASTMLAKQVKNKNFKKILVQVSQDLTAGESLSISYRKYPNAFPPLLVNVISVAEVSGSLESNLKQMAKYYEKTSESKSNMITAMIYPIMMMIAALGVGVFLIVAIVPMFVTVFENFDAELPWITKFTLSLSDFLTTKGLWLLLIIGLSVVVFVAAQKNPQFRLRYDGFKLKLPIFGEFIQKSNFSLLMTTLSSLLISSVPMVKSLAMSKEVVPNVFIKDLVSQCEIEIEQGGKLSNILSGNQSVPLVLAQMVEIGENTGSLEEMLAKLSLIFEKEVDEISKRIKTIVEPLVMVVIAVIVGFIVMAIMLPMFEMYTTIQG